MSVWSSLVGQDHVVATLTQAVREPRAMTHAWLFTGPPGSGRSVAARAFAAALQCEEGTGCGTCKGCRMTLAGTHPDVTTVSTEKVVINIQEVRDLVATASRSASQGRWRIVIVEDADRMVERTSIAFCAVIAPGAFIAFMLAVLVASRRTPVPRWVGQLMRLAALVQPWSMSEVMLLGILVALIKIAHLATVIPGIGLYAVGVLVVLLAIVSMIFEPRAIWNRVVWADGTVPSRARPAIGHHERPGAARARLPSLVACTTCGLLARPAPPGETGRCPRCGAVLAERRHFSIQTTWALVVAAAILFVPAMAFPVLVTTTFGSSEPSTILSGVVFLYQEGSWVLALIVLVASVIVPIGKLVALGYLMVTVQRGSAKSNHDRTRLYRLVEIIGRWSMLDVFVVAFITALVQLDPLMSVSPGIGVMYFMAVVVLTMIAAHSFDPRLIWNPGATARSAHA